MKKKIKINAAKIQRAVSRSSKIEGLSLDKAKKNKKLIQVIKNHGRAFAVSRQR